MTGWGTETIGCTHDQTCGEVQVFILDTNSTHDELRHMAEVLRDHALTLQLRDYIDQCKQQARIAAQEAIREAPRHLKLSGTGRHAPHQRIHRQQRR